MISLRIARRLAVVATALALLFTAVAHSRAADAAYGRFGKITQGDKTLDLGAHNDNPFPSKAACEAGIDEDKATIALWLAQQGIDPATTEIIVECRLAGQPA